MLATKSVAAWWSKTADEISRLGEEDGSILLLPVGSIEQHGKHLPVATDTLLVEAVATAAAEEVPDDLPILVAPPCWAGYSPHHLSFGGTFTLKAPTMQSLLSELADSALGNGFDALMFVNGHGGNIPHIGVVTSTVGERHPEAEILGVTYFQLAEPFVDEIRESEVGGMSHGGEFETSLMLHFYPELVRTGRFDAEPLDEPYDQGLDDMFQGGPLGIYRRFEAYSDSGAIGAPELASAEKGEELATGLITSLGSIITEIHERHRTDG